MPSLETRGHEYRQPCLEGWLSRGDRTETFGRDGLATLCGHFGVAAESGSDLPTAPLAALGDGLETDAAPFWLHADPVFLRPDRDRLLLFDERVLDPTSAEAQSLAHLFNHHFAEDGIRLHVPNPTRWYLAVPGPPGVQTQPLHEAVGRDIRRFLPTGEGVRRWNGLMNEVQMLFHGADVNREREAAGKPPINGLWLWGGGRLPAVQPQERVGRVIGDHPLARGLAQWAGLPWEPLSANWISADQTGDSLVFDDALWPSVYYADAPTWTDALSTLNRRCGGLDRDLADGRLGEIRLHACNGDAWVIRRGSRWRVWRRRQPLARWLK